AVWGCFSPPGEGWPSRCPACCRGPRRPSSPRRRRRAKSRVRALASPASLKGVLSAREAATALVEGLRRGGAEAEALPIADGGEGTADVLGAEVRKLVPVPDAFGRPREAPLRAFPDG